MGKKIDSHKDQKKEVEYQKMIEMKDYYLSVGLEIIPIKYGTKIPLVSGFLESPIGDLWENIQPPFNIGLKLGKVCDLENDDENFGIRLDRKLAKLIKGDYPKYKSKRGYHRLIIVKGAPDQSNIHWKDRKLTKKECLNRKKFSNKQISNLVHTGELRIKKCQSIIPFSLYQDDEGNTAQYEWCGDYKTHLSNIPSIRWTDIRHMVKNYNRKQKKEYVKPPLETIYRNISIEGKFIQVLQLCAEAKKGSQITVKDENNPSKCLSFKSRSEAEIAVVARMISCGYPFDRIFEIYENIKPGNYYSKNPKDAEKRKQYLQTLYQKNIDSSFRLAVKREYDTVRCLTMSDRIYCILLSLAFQNNLNKVVASYKQLCEYLGLKINSKTGPYKSCKKLERAGLIKINPGSRKMSDKKATTFELLKIEK